MSENNAQAQLTTLANDLPSPYKENALALVDSMFSVIEGLSDDDTGGEWKIPTLKLVQAMTDRSTLPKNAHIGSLLIGEEVLPQPLKIIPIRSWLSRVLWDKNDLSAKSLCWSPDATMGFQGTVCKTCPRSAWQEEAKTVDCTLSRNFLVMSDDLKYMFKIVFSKTNYKFGTELLDMMKKATVATYKKSYNLSSESGAVSKNVEALVPKVGDSVPPALHAFLECVFKTFSEDRKEVLAQFQANAIARRNSSPQLADASGGNDDSTLLIASTSEAGDKPADMGGYKL